MITKTFQHISGVSAKAEKKFWKDGMLTWQHYVDRKAPPRDLFNNIEIPSELKPSFEAFDSEDMDFFAAVFPRKELYRIALQYPKDVMFLDIETTGLSLYYDQITIIGWTLGKDYGVYIAGQDSTAFFEAAKQAKAVVTFNGTLFDLKFIKKRFEEVQLPTVHIDLRFLAKRVGLTGGQKEIEKEIGFDRNHDLEGMLGEAAPILWHKYRRGEHDALKRLIEYNHADVEGMKDIFDVCVERLFKQDSIPKKVQSTIQFKKLRSNIEWASKKVPSSSKKIYIPGYVGDNKPLITFDELKKIISLDDFCVVGIDLVSSEERETGYCILKGHHAETSRVKTDEEMIQMAIDAGADLISIDSPLSIPKGRTTFWDDDPFRDEFGITRECERILKRRGISSYPCLIPSMQKLTQRGMLLAQKFRERGIPVIESYPGAAQDIMCIPRKQAGLEYLIEGLKEFGITGDFIDIQVSHDELDAITSAIVGCFFWSGKFEALGNDDEEYLFIPDLNGDDKSWLSRSIVGLSGSLGAGKTTASAGLTEQGYAYSRFSLVLEQLLKDKNQKVSRSSLQALGSEIRETKGQRWLGKQALRLVEGEPKIVIDGLRFPEDHALFVETFGPSYLHAHISCTNESREKRSDLRKEDIAFAEAASHELESKSSLLKKLASVVIDNKETIAALKLNISSVVKKDSHAC